MLLPSPLDSRSRRVEITDLNRFLRVEDHRLRLPRRTHDRGRRAELVAGIEAALNHVDAMSLEHKATRIPAPAMIG